MASPIDPESPVPLYHQIAEAIRARITRGELTAGDSLDPMRRAADQWGVNLHTVRHAYAALAREGLLEMRSTRGTRVTDEAARLRVDVQEDAAAFVERVVREALDRHGMGAGELAARVAAHGSEGRAQVTLVECNAWQCDAHVAEIEKRWQVDGRSLPLSDGAEPGGDTVITTYFHYNDIRRRWPHLLERVKFLTVRVDETVVKWLGATETAVVVERDEPTAEAVAADLRGVLGREIELRTVVTDDAAAFIRKSTGEHVLCSPRVWSDLDEDVRSNECCSVVRYRFDRRELDALARDLAWRPKNSEVESPR